MKNIATNAVRAPSRVAIKGTAFVVLNLADGIIALFGAISAAAAKVEHSVGKFADHRLVNPLVRSYFAMAPAPLSDTEANALHNVKAAPKFAAMSAVVGVADGIVWTLSKIAEGFEAVVYKLDDIGDRVWNWASDIADRIPEFKREPRGL